MGNVVLMNILSPDDRMESAYRTSLTCRKAKILFEKDALRTSLARDLLFGDAKAKVVCCIDRRLPLACLAESLIELASTDVSECVDVMLSTAREQRRPMDDVGLSICLEMGIRAISLICPESARDCASGCLKRFLSQRHLRTKVVRALLTMPEIDDGKSGEDDEVRIIVRCRRYIIPPSSGLLMSFVLCSMHHSIPMLRCTVDARPDIVSCVDKDDVLVKCLEYNMYDQIIFLFEFVMNERRGRTDFIEPVLYEALRQMFDYRTSINFKSLQTYLTNDYDSDDEDSHSARRSECSCDLHIDDVEDLIRVFLQNPRTPVSKRSLSAARKKHYFVPDDILQLLLEHPSVKHLRPKKMKGAR
jgi:hypothetical protein